MIISLKNGEQREFAPGLTVYDITKQISEGLARAACCAKVNDNIVDLREVIREDCRLSILTFDDPEGRRAFRHTAAHVLAQAVKRLYPQTKLAIGPSTEEGFYYDFDREKPFSAEEIVQIEAEMKKIIKEDLKPACYVLSREKSVADMQAADEHYKVELIQDLPEDAKISFYAQGEFTDLCAGPHLMSLKSIKAVKLMSDGGSSGAYWRGSEKNKMLSRIYGTAFPKPADLEAYLLQKEEAKKRDHNKLGRELDFFTTSEVIGQGLPLLMPKGAKAVQLMQRFVEDEEEKKGYVLTKTPFMGKSDLYKISGHWDHYRDGMFVIGDEQKDEELLALRPMTCPFQFSIYNARQKSYRDLPIRYSETSTLFRNESSGEMHGLIRMRQFTISEGHLVCTEDQLEAEFKGVVELVKGMMATLGLDEDMYYRFSKWDPNAQEKYIGDKGTWEKTQDIMGKLLSEMGLNCQEAIGEAAFYGPKLDIQYKNVHGKEDTIVTIQIDFALAQRFNMTYVETNSEKKHPIVIHRTSIGCYERTLAMLIEKYAGALPTWLSYVQVAVLPISEKYNQHAQVLVEQMKKEGIRAWGDYRGEKIGFKIREARNQRIPYLFVVGEKEQQTQTVSLRSRKGDEGSTDLFEAISRVHEVINNKTNDAGVTLEA